jgi:hypothetical protein
VKKIEISLADFRNWEPGSTVTDSAGRALLASEDGPTIEALSGPDAPYLYEGFVDIDAGDNHQAEGLAADAASTPVSPGCRRVAVGFVGVGVPATRRTL